MKKLLLEIDARHQKRSDFLLGLRKEMVYFLNFFENHRVGLLIGLLTEMLKNIYDHCEEKQGSLELRKTKDIIFFSLKDSGTKNYNWDECIGHTSHPDSSVNLGAGLRILSQANKIHGLKLKIDTSCGFQV